MINYRPFTAINLSNKLYRLNNQYNSKLPFYRNYNGSVSLNCDIMHTVKNYPLIYTSSFRTYTFRTKSTYGTTTILPHTLSSITTMNNKRYISSKLKKLRDKKRMQEKKKAKEEAKKRKSSDIVAGSVRVAGPSTGDSNNNNNNNNSKENKKKKKYRQGEGNSKHTTLSLENISKYINYDQPLFENVSLAFREGAKIGVLGINGAGKSSFLRVIAGEDKDFEGERKTSASVIGYLPQEPTLDPTTDVKGNVIMGLPKDHQHILREYNLVCLSLNKENLEKEYNSDIDYNTHNETSIDLLEKSVEELEEKKQQLETQMVEMGIGDLNRRIEQAMFALRCPPPGSRVDRLSGGEIRRIALCKLLVSTPDILLLDEPTNHLDAGSVAWLEHFLSKYKGTVLAVTHDRYFLDNVAGWILEFDRGNLLPFRGNYSEWLENKAHRLELEDQRAKALARKMKNELEWIRKTPKGKQSKNKARITAFEKLQDKASQGKKYETGSVILPFGQRLGNEVISATSITKKFGEKVLIDNLDFTIPPGAIVGVIGPNGAGKTTLCRILLGEIEPDKGEISIGQTVTLGFVSQSRGHLDPEETVYEAVSEGLENVVLASGDILDIRAYLSSFHFKKDMQSRLIGELSGGERNRAHLAQQLKDGYNVLILDEPTNDLDVEVLRSLEDSLFDFPGSAIVVSHDRWFLDRLCTHIMAFEGDGKVYFHEGSYGSYEETRRRELGENWNPLGNVKHRKLGF